MLTEEQIEMRWECVPASELAAIMGDDPYKTRDQLLKDKIERKRKFVNSAMRQGNIIEPIARDLFFDIRGIEMLESGTLVHPDRIWQVATPDGVSRCGKYTLEIKSNGIYYHELAKEGIIPKNHMWQVQQHLEVTNAESGFYMSCFCKNNQILDQVIIAVPRDSEMMSRGTKEGYLFWQELMNYVPLEECTDLAWKEAMQNAIHCCEQEKAFKRQKEEWLEKAVKIAGEKESVGFGYSLKQCSRIGNVDYSQIPELRTVDLELYRKQPTKYWKAS